ncbi:hypothetical protein IU433_09840 [Nocardia puris]|uniref:hypothetical protein n=1 Tax=Nocardia puris TaxID=208602 RepID=UPI0018952BE8|nr:hypothetical protein [Nocardia puris]MBF6364407.1 hypothetical protein [Nocardia puris]MBF6459336.1 hypothetical protein [Nocardia puris]
MSVDLAGELCRLEEEGSTGVLRAGDGVFHFSDGAITSVDCPRTTGLERLAVEAGVVTTEDWRRAGSGDAAPLLKKPKLETLAVLSVYDAAYFVLTSDAAPEFRPTAPHWLSGVCRVRPRALVRECVRRGDSGPWLADLVDRVPVVPARRVPQERVTLTGGQAEVLAAADARRSIAGIARELGRTTYGCLVAVRDLTEAGLIAPPEAVPAEAVSRGSDGVARRGPRHARVESAEFSDSVGLVRHSPPQAGSPALPLRRRAQASVPVPAADRWQPVDRDLLVRLRVALRELT